MHSHTLTHTHVDSAPTRINPHTTPTPQQIQPPASLDYRQIQALVGVDRDMGVREWVFFFFVMPDIKIKCYRGKISSLFGIDLKRDIFAIQFMIYSLILDLEHS